MAKYKALTGSAVKGLTKRNLNQSQTWNFWAPNLNTKNNFSSHLYCVSR